MPERLTDMVQRWLPDPNHHFVGGPMHGTKRAVEYIQTTHGMVAPEFWRCYELPKADRPLVRPDGLKAAQVVEVVSHLYRLNRATGIYHHVPGS